MAPPPDVRRGLPRRLCEFNLRGISLIIGGLALARSRRVGSGGRAAAIVAPVLGLIGVILSVVHLGGAGAFGTGGGRAGAIVALVLSLIVWEGSGSCPSLMQHRLAFVI